MSTTCQICGRDIKLTHGVIAHHGYRRMHSGYQTRSCEGARHQSYETSCAAIQPAIERRLSWIEARQRDIANMMENPPAELCSRDVYGKVRQTFSRPAGFAAFTTIATPSHQLRLHTYEARFCGEVRKLRDEIAGTRADIEHLSQRLSGWKAAA